MKKNYHPIFFIVHFFLAIHRIKKIEKEIRQLEQKRVTALMTKDTAALLKIWATDYFVNRPAGAVSTRGQVLSMVLNDTISFKSLEFEIEKIVVKKNFAIVMGSDTADPGEKSPYAGKNFCTDASHIFGRMKVATEDYLADMPIFCANR